LRNEYQAIPQTASRGMSPEHYTSRGAADIKSDVLVL
jgi:hypothetical protein